MKITRREGKETGGRFAVSVLAQQVDRVESALTYLEELEGKPYSHVIVDTILATARRKGWKPPTREPEASQESRSPALAAA